MQELTPLLSVVTVNEAALLYGVSPKTIRYHIDRGNLSYRITLDNRVLIDLASLQALHQRIYKIPIKTSLQYLQARA